MGRQNRAWPAGSELTRPTSVLVDCDRRGDDDDDDDGGDYGYSHDDDDDDRGGRSRDRRDVLYVTNKATAPAIGEVLRLVR